MGWGHPEGSLGTQTTGAVSWGRPANSLLANQCRFVPHALQDPSRTRATICDEYRCCCTGIRSARETGRGNRPRRRRSYGSTTRLFAGGNYLSRRTMSAIALVCPGRACNSRRHGTVGRLPPSRSPMSVPGGSFDADSVRAAWDRAADAYTAGQAAGRDYYRTEFFGPAQVALCGDVHGLRLLDVGCGSGYFAREMARRGARVTAIDVSPRMIELPRAAGRLVRPHAGRGLLSARVPGAASRGGGVAAPPRPRGCRQGAVFRAL